MNADCWSSGKLEGDAAWQHHSPGRWHTHSIWIFMQCAYWYPGPFAIRPNCLKSHMNMSTQTVAHDARTISVRHVDVFPIRAGSFTFITSRLHHRLIFLELLSVASLACLPRNTDHIMPIPEYHHTIVWDNKFTTSESSSQII